MNDIDQQSSVVYTIYTKYCMTCTRDVYRVANVIFTKKTIFTSIILATRNGEQFVH